MNNVYERNRSLIGLQRFQFSKWDGTEVVFQTTKSKANYKVVANIFSVVLVLKLRKLIPFCIIGIFGVARYVKYLVLNLVQKMKFNLLRFQCLLITSPLTIYYELHFFTYECTRKLFNTSIDNKQKQNTSVSVIFL